MGNTTRATATAWLSAFAAVVAIVASGCSAGQQAGADEVGFGDGASPGTTAGHGVVRIGHVGELVSDPLAVAATDSASVMLVDALTDGLTSVDDDGSVVPAVASSWDSADGATWRFTIDRTRTWSDGTPISAQDARATLERALGLRSERLAGARLADLVGDASGDAAISVEDDDTVVVTLASPNYELPAALAGVAYGIVPAAVISDEPADGLDLLDGVVANSGPFAGTRVVGESPVVRLEARDGDSDAVRQVEFVEFGSAEEAWTAYEAGDVDLVEADAGEADADEADADGSVGGDRAEVEAVGATVVAALGSNGAFADPAVRAGVAAALSAGGAAGSLWESLLVGIDVSSLTPAGDTAVMGALAGVPLEVHIGPGSATRAVGDRVVSVLSEAGVAVRRVDHTVSSMGESLAGGADVIVFAVPGLQASGGLALTALVGTGGAENVAGFSAAVVDELLAAARSSAETSQRRQSYSAALRAAVDAGALVPLGTIGDVWTVSSRLSFGVGGVDERLAATPFDLAAIRVER